MKQAPDYIRFPMIHAAWQVAVTAIDAKGVPKEDLGDVERKFLKRSCCKGLDPEDCRRVFQDAIAICQLTIQFQRTECGTLSPTPSRRYTHLQKLATQLESQFPESELALILAACRLIEAHWDR